MIKTAATITNAAKAYPNIRIISKVSRLVSIDWSPPPEEPELWLKASDKAFLHQEYVKWTMVNDIAPINAITREALRAL